MGSFTFVPIWVIGDILIYIATAMTIFYIVKKEPRPIATLMEMFCFTMLYASIYENTAAYAKLFGYGRSILMIFNVPLSIPLFEFLVLYSSLKLLERMKISTWCKPLIAGLFAVVADFSLDPVAVKQIYQTKEALIGRWTWFVNPPAVMIYDEPVSNFTGWMAIIGFAGIFFLLGRWWYQKTNYHPVVGYVYPILACVASLLTLYSPASKFLLYLEPFYKAGSSAEWFMLALCLIIPVVLLLVFWRGRMNASISLGRDFPILFNLAGFPVINLIFCLIGGFTQILWLVVVSLAVMWILVGSIWAAGRKAPHSIETVGVSTQKGPAAV